MLERIDCQELEGNAAGPKYIFVAWLACLHAVSGGPALSTDGPLAIFIDTLRFDVRELKEQSVQRVD